MTTINNVKELWAVMPEYFTNHVQGMDSDLPTTSIERLEFEFQQGPPPEDGNNYVPAYYGVGTICRALDIAQSLGFEIGPAFDGFPRY